MKLALVGSKLLYSFKKTTMVLGSVGTFFVSSACVRDCATYQEAISADPGPEGLVPLYNYRSGRWENVSDQYVQAAIATGRYGARKDKPLPAIDPQGDHVWLSAEEAAAAFNRGYRYEGAREQRQRYAMQAHKDSKWLDMGQFNLWEYLGVIALLWFPHVTVAILEKWIRWLTSDQPAPG